MRRDRLTARLLEFFLSVVDAGTVTHAAERLNIAQPSLSEAISILELELGTPLFTRTRRGMVPTEAGLALVQPAQQVLDGLTAVEDTARAVNAVARGRLDISVPSGLVVEPFSMLATRFRDAYPNVLLNLRRPTGIDRVVKQVQQHVSDVGVTYVTDDMGTLEITNLAPVDLMLAFPPHFEPLGPTVGPAELARLPLIALTTLTTPRRAIERYAAAHRTTANVVIETNHEGGYIQLVRAGAGVAVMSSESARLAALTGLRIRPLDPPLRLDVGVVHRDGPLSPAAAAFVQIAQHSRITDTRQL